MGKTAWDVEINGDFEPLSKKCANLLGVSKGLGDPLLI